MKIGVADTTFSRVDLFAFVKEQLNELNFSGEIERYTVPGVKDLPVACQKLFKDFNCDIVLALGMPGREKIDKTCSHEASMSIQQVQLLFNKHILEVFVHLDEAMNDKQLYEIAKNRTKKHVLNAVKLIESKTSLSYFAGKGLRQGFENEGTLAFSKSQVAKNSSQSEREINLGLVVCDFHSDITKKMESIALAHAKKLNAKIVKTIHVPGAFDAPLAVKKLLKEKDVQGVVVLGTVIQGETSHDELVAFSCAEKVLSLSLEFNKPVGFGVSGPRISKENAVNRIKPYSERAVEAALSLINSLEE
ncbi:MAG: riboflavin synthase [archaeon]